MKDYYTAGYLAGLHGDPTPVDPWALTDRELAEFESGWRAGVDARRTCRWELDRQRVALTAGPMGA